ncbi:MAG: type II toxin-antitoxin system prevent-host-death family antitoxin [Cyanobacteria bacterium J06554_11]
MEIAAGHFKAQCLKLMDKVQQTREEIVITKHGKPVARLVPIESEPSDSIVGWMKGSITVTGDIVSPVEEIWDADVEQ